MANTLMTGSPNLIQCPNPDCRHGDNFLGNVACDRCQTPLTYRYLRAVGQGASQAKPGELVAGRYSVVAPRLWLDTQPAEAPTLPDTMSDAALAYLRLYPYQLHVPTLFGVCPGALGEILLLDAVPVNERGQWLPSLSQEWPTATPARQLYWLWQLLRLWPVLNQAGVGTSLTVGNNLCVEGWRVRLRELIPDSLVEHSGSLGQVVHLWQEWLPQASPAIADSLRQFCQVCQGGDGDPSEAEFQALSHRLNLLLLEQTLPLPLQLTVAGATTTGPQRPHNEDACYPITGDALAASRDPLIPNVAMICDGIGGHAGGEVASQMALRSLQLQALALLTDVNEQTELTQADVVQQQLEAVLRVVNNLIFEQNNSQGRVARERMGTTVVMALQLPQSGVGNTHELYLVNAGDSRAYWITPTYCQRLTVDDDVATREVKTGRALPWEARRRPDAGALTQAIGTKQGDLLQATVQRFIVDEDGVLLLCSDGLSDGDRIEQFWQQVMRPLFKGSRSLEETASAWIEIANRYNGHDNASVVLMQCLVTAPQPAIAPIVSAKADSDLSAEPEPELAASARALLYDQEPDLPADPFEPPPSSIDPVETSPKPIHVLTLAVGVAVLMFLLGAGGVMGWRSLNPQGFESTIESLLNRLQPPNSDEN